MITHEDQFRIAKALGLPDETIRFTLEMSADDGPVVTCTYFPDLNSDDIETIVKVCKELEYE